MEESSAYSPSEVAKLFVTYAPNELERLGLPSKRSELQRFLKKSFLGKGVYGSAFDIGDQKVLKITTDSQDALSCKMVMDKGGVEGVAQIYDVFQFNSGKLSPYGIVLEKVISFAELKKQISKGTATKLLKMLDLAFKQTYDADEPMKLDEDPGPGIRKWALRSKLSEEEVETSVRWAEQLVRTLIELRHLKVFVWDLHPWNAGFRILGENLDLVLFDLGNRSFRGEHLEVRLAANV